MMPPTERAEFVVAFNGARDGYQVALALHERGMLSKLVTDLYAPAPVACLGRLIPPLEKLAHRNAPGLPFAKVRWNTSLINYQYLRPLLPFERSYTRGAQPSLQSVLSGAALRIAEINNANLLCYAGYAYQAFESPRSRPMRKGLFQYHPHVDLSAVILGNDLKRYTSLKKSLIQLETATADMTNFQELNQANFVICASSFIARSVAHIGIAPSKLHVVPYGIDVAAEPVDLPMKTVRSDVCRFLFVGTGIHRKGLHNLFHAWHELRAPGAHLTVVSRYIDPEIASLQPPDRVTVLPAQSDSALRELYETTHVFILPSLIEGFGYVYLEALASGCYCIGTENTGFPDIGCPEYAGSLAVAGDISSLVDAMQRAYSLFRKRELDHEAIRAFARFRPWSVFRAEVADICARQTQLATSPSRRGRDQEANSA